MDKPVKLEPNTRLIVTILPKLDEEGDCWFRVSGQGLARAYGEDEDEYTLDFIREANPEYAGG